MATLTLPKKSLPPGATLPYDDGEPLESDWHVIVMNLLIGILRYYWWECPDIYVAGNMFVYFDPEQVKTRNFRGPDVFVVKGVRHKNPRNSWVVWEEDGLTPDYVIELASESTAQFDVTAKRAIHERDLQTPEYVVYDPITQRLRGWRLDVRGRYQELVLDGRGWLWSEQLGLWLGQAEYLIGGHTEPLRVVRFFDAAGQMLPTEAEAVVARAQRETRRADEQARRAETEAQRADEEARRADEEARRAEAEAAARRAAEAEIARLKALLQQR
ncbi:MAG: Uma2 family endonuclease [Candidatus Competibacteraceae bacterium]